MHAFREKKQWRNVNNYCVETLQIIIRFDDRNL